MTTDRARLEADLVRHGRMIRHALLREFGGMGLGATDFIRLLMRKLTFDQLRLSLAAFVRER